MHFSPWATSFLHLWHIQFDLDASEILKLLTTNLDDSFNHFLFPTIWHCKNITLYICRYKCNSSVATLVQIMIYKQLPLFVNILIHIYTCICVLWIRARKRKVIAKNLTFIGIVHITTNTNKDSLKLSTTFWTISENSRYHTLILKMQDWNTRSIIGKLVWLKILWF